MFVLRYTSAFVLISSVFGVTFECYPCECRSEDCNITEADCSTRTTEVQIEEIPKDLSNNIEHLDLTGQRLQVLEESVFENANLIGLKQLCLQNCQIREIHINAFANMSKLTILEANANKLSYIHNATFSWMKKLQTLNLRDNTIQNLTFIQNLTQLVSLLLKNNEITYLNENVFVNHSKLEKLELSHNKIDILPDKLFNNLKNLKYLHLSFNKLSRIPNNIFQNNSELRNLFLEYNTIIELKENFFNNLTTLNILDLQHNKIIKIPENIFLNLFKLENIKINNNEIETIPNNTFKNLSRLHVLDLSYNKINTINTGFLDYSSCINGFQYVCDIFLNHNNISFLPAEIFRNTCQKLRINLSYNNISSIDSNTFSHADIMHLNLSNNKISFLSSKSFTNIDELDLSFNNLSIFPTGIFSSINKRLILINNNIKIISWTLFGSNKLSALILANNSITYFELNVTNFYFMDMSNNPINCDCKLKKQHELFMNKILIVQCASPLALKGKAWYTLNSNQFTCGPEIKDNFTETKDSTTSQIGCKVFASPAPDIQWLKYNETIQENDTTIRETRTTLTEDMYWYNLTFLKNATDFDGQYSCVLNNSAGTADMNFTVLQQVQPAPTPEESTHSGNAIWITIVVLILIVVLAALARVYRKRRLRNDRSNSVSNRLYDHLDIDTGSLVL